MPSIPRLTSPSSNRTCGFPASGSPGHSELSLKLLPQGGGTGRERGQGGWFPNAATIPPRCSVVALSGKRFSSHFVQSACPVRPLRSTGVAPLPGYYGPIRLPQGRYNGILGGLPEPALSKANGSSRLIFRHMLPPYTPESPRAVFARCLTLGTGFTIPGRPATLALSIEADSGSLIAAACAFVHQGFARQIALPCAWLTTRATSNSHGELLSVHKISQA
jgi:hypothetical protein